MDTDCTGNAVHKCCPEHNSGLNVCVKPVPGRLAFSEEGRKTVNISFFAILQWSQHYIKMSIFTACRDGKKVNARDVFEQKCAEVASEYCIDRGCEDGPEGDGGWGSACCGGYPFQWVPGASRPSKKFYLFH